MLFSFKKLKEMANLVNKTTVEDVVKAINSIGFEVEDFKKFSDIEGIKFGKVLKVSKNSNSEKLHVCEIRFNDKIRTIQTTAKNVTPGMVVVAFIPGSKANGMIFEAKKMQGIVSEGMLSSLNEFGIEKELIRTDVLSGIASYNGVSDLSIDPVEYLDLDDYIIDVSILTNRADASSYYVMALELAAYFDRKTQVLQVKEGSFKSKVNIKTGNSHFLVGMETTNDFSISLKEQIFLAKHNIKSINNAVDLTNLTLLMAGQPTHAYDMKKIGDNLTSSFSSNKVETLGDKEVKLEKNLVIKSDEIPVSLAGVIGFENSKIDENTEKLLIELGSFPSEEIRKSIKTIKLDTMAGSRSSKGLSIGTLSFALSFLTNKLSTFSEPVNLPKEKTTYVDFDINEVERYAGESLTKNARYKKAIIALEKIGFEFIGDKVKVPSYRYDVKLMQDIIEEIFRFYGYDNFKPMQPQIKPFINQKMNNLKDEIKILGFDEINTYSLISSQLNNINPFGFKKTIKLMTFVSKEREEIRNSQLRSLLEVIEYNSKRKMEDLNIFSKGMINDGIKTIAIASTVKSFSEFKKSISNVLPSNFSYQRAEINGLHPNVCAKVMLKNEQIGIIGQVHPSFSKKRTMFLEFFNKNYNSEKITFSEYDEMPLKMRDVTFVLKEKESIETHLSYIKSLNPFNYKIIDEFKNDGEIKVTVRITGQDALMEKIDKKYN